MKRRLILVLPFASLLYGCSTIVPLRETQGRFSLQIPEQTGYQNWSGSFSLQMWNRQTIFNVLTPLGGILYQIQIRKEQAFLYKGQNQLLQQSSSFEKLTQKILGIQLSVEQLFDWANAKEPRQRDWDRWRVLLTMLPNGKARIVITEQNVATPIKLTLIFQK